MYMIHLLIHPSNQQFAFKGGWACWGVWKERFQGWGWVDQEKEWRTIEVCKVVNAPQFNSYSY